MNNHAQARSLLAPLAALACIIGASYRTPAQQSAHLFGASVADPYTGEMVSIGFAKEYASTCAVGWQVPVPGMGPVVLRAGTPRAFRFTSGFTTGEEIGSWMRIARPVPARRCVVVIEDQEFGVITLSLQGGAGPSDFAMATSTQPGDLDYVYDPRTGELRPIGAGSTTSHNGLALLSGITDAPVTRIDVVSRGLSRPIDWVGFGMGLLGPPRGPQFEVSPVDARARAGDMIPTQFTATACGAPPLAFRWQITTGGPSAPDNEWSDLMDGPISFVGGVVAGSVAGAETPAVTFSDVNSSWWPSPVHVRCRATDGGGAAVSAPAEFLVEVCPQALYFNLNPQDQPGCYGTVSEFTATAQGDPVLQYSWRKDGEQMSDGPGPSGSIIEGAFTSALRISNVQFPDAGLYECVVSNPCGFAISSPARLSLCPGDFNCDGGIDGSDVDSFFGVWEAGLPGADVNVDGGVDGGDISTFFGVWEAGGCYGCVRGPDVNFDDSLNCVDFLIFRTLLREGHLAADFSCDGLLDVSDEAAFLTVYFGGGGPVCPCEQPVDRNQDGVVDCTDYGAFYEAYVAGSPEADFNCDTFVDFDDYLAYLWAYDQLGGPTC